MANAAAAAELELVEELVWRVGVDDDAALGGGDEAAFVDGLVDEGRPR